MKKYDIYASVRRLRQAAGDTAESFLQTHSEQIMDKATAAKEWQEWLAVEHLLNEAECKLELMNLKEND